MRIRVLALAALWALLAIPSSVGAQRTRLYQDEEKHFEVRVPKWLEPVPGKPGDLQTLAKFKGTKESKKKPHRGELTLELLVVRIPRREAVLTGKAKKEAEDPEDDASMAEKRIARLNGGRTVEQYLKARGYWSNVSETDEVFRKPLEDPDDRPYVVMEVPKRRGSTALRAFVVRDDAEIFGVIAVGVALNPFHKEIVRVVKSLRREVRRPEEDDEGDPYEESKLRDIDRRREVREELVHGWRAFDSENFILVTNARSKKLIDRMLVDLEIMRVAYFERFPPAEGADMSPVSTVRVCDGYEDYLRYAGQGLRGTGGYWNFVEEELVLFNPEKKVPRALRWVKKVDPSAVLYHEAMHQFLHYSNRALAPAPWFNEGYGEVFGGARLDRNKLAIKSIRKNKHRTETVKLVEKKRDIDRPDLSTLLKMTKPQFYGRRASLNYAYGWAFCYFLEQQRKKPERTRNEAWANLPDRYLSELRKAADAERAKLPEGAPDDKVYENIFEIQATAIKAALEGIDMAELEKAWVKFVRRI